MLLRKAAVIPPATYLDLAYGSASPHVVDYHRVFCTRAPALSTSEDYTESFTSRCIVAAFHPPPTYV